MDNTKSGLDKLPTPYIDSEILGAIQNNISHASCKDLDSDCLKITCKYSCFIYDSSKGSCPFIHHNN